MRPLAPASAVVRSSFAIVLALATFLVVACGSEGESKPRPAEVVPVSSTTTGLAAFVDPFIGTGDGFSPDPVGNGLTGATFPGATVPFGMVQFSPDTPATRPPGYHYDDSSIIAFSLTHLNGAGCPAFRDVQIFPFASRPDFGEKSEASFSHANEKASPGFYEVKLDTDILVDLTATARSGFARFTFPEGADPYIRLASNNSIDVVTANVDGFEAHVVGSDMITGSRDGARFCATRSKYRLYYAIRFDRPFDGFGTITEGVETDGSRDVSGVNTGAFAHFPTTTSRVVHMKVGLSYVSVEHAIANMDAENQAWDFDAVHDAALGAWNERLDKVQVEGGDDDAKRALYTALYHSLVQPAVFSDVDGSYIGFDGQVHVDAAHPRYANFSGWDVYRSWIQLVAVLAPREASDLARSLIEASKECGALPRWSIANSDSGMMIGDPASPTIAGAWAFGARDFDPAEAVVEMKKGATNPNAKCNEAVARPCLADYMSRGYCPDLGTTLEGAVSITQEYAVADFAIAQMAKAAKDDATHTAFVQRAGSWRNVLDMSYPGGPLPRPRNKDDVAGAASFIETDLTTGAGFTEGNAAQYTFMVPQDPYGLITALGGEATTIARLDELFKELNAGVKRPHFYMGNEPQFATPWLYPYAGAPHKTQAVVRRILREVYSTKPGGLPGNDDLGATSAWQVWGLLGLYPVVPGSGTLILASPWFPKTTITLGSGKQLTIIGTGAAPDAPYVQSAKLDGQPMTRSYLTYDEIAGGKTVELVLGKAANTSWGAAEADHPPVP